MLKTHQEFVLKYVFKEIGGKPRPGSVFKTHLIAELNGLTIQQTCVLLHVQLVQICMAIQQLNFVLSFVLLHIMLMIRKDYVFNSVRLRMDYMVLSEIMTLEFVKDSVHRQMHMPMLKLLIDIVFYRIVLKAQTKRLQILQAKVVFQFAQLILICTGKLQHILARTNASLLITQTQ